MSDLPALQHVQPRTVTPRPRRIDMLTGIFKHKTAAEKAADEAREINKYILASEFNTAIAKAGYAGLKSDVAGIVMLDEERIECHMHVNKRGFSDIYSYYDRINRWEQLMGSPALKEI